MDKNEIAEIVRDMQKGVINFTNNGECSNCGKCCSALLPMTDKEFKTLKTFVRYYKYKPHKVILPLADGAVNSMTCPFRNEETKRCDVYSIRPRICRDFKCDKPSKGEFADIKDYAGVKTFNLWEDLFNEA